MAHLKDELEEQSAQDNGIHSEGHLGNPDEVKGEPENDDLATLIDKLPKPPAPLVPPTIDLSSKQPQEDAEVNNEADDTLPEVPSNEGNGADKKDSSEVKIGNRLSKAMDSLVTNNRFLSKINLTGKRRPIPSNFYDEKTEAESHKPVVVVDSYQNAKKEDTQARGNFTENNKIGYILRHHLEKSTDITKLQVANFVFSTAAAGMSLALYPKPVKDFAGDDLAAVITFIACAMIANLGVGAYAASETFKSFTKHLPDFEARLINNHLNKGKVKKVIRLVTASVLAVAAAVPYALAADEIWKKIIVEIGNAIMSYYAINNLMFEHAGIVIEALTRSQKTTAYKKLLSSFDHSVDSITYELIRRKEIGKIRSVYGKNSQELIQFLTDQATKLAIKPYRPLTPGQIVGRRIVPAIGSMAIANGGLLIYVLKTYEEMAKNNPNADIANMPISGVISLPFLYLANVFAIRLFWRIADALTCNGKKPIAMQLYPVATVVTMLTNALVVSGSFGAIAGLILRDAHFGQDGVFSQITTPAVIIGAVAAVLFNLFPNWELDTYIIEELGLRFGSAENKDYIKFDRQMRAFLTTIKKVMSPEIFLEAIDSLDKSQKAALLKMWDSRDNIQTLINTASSGETKEENLSLLGGLQRNSRRLLGRLVEENKDEELEKFTTMKQAHRSQHLRNMYGSLNKTDEEIKEVEAEPKASAWQRFKDCLPSAPCPKITFFSNFSFTKRGQGQYEPISTEEEEKPFNSIV